MDLSEKSMEFRQQLHRLVLRKRSHGIDIEDISAWLQFDWMPEPFQKLAGFSPDRTPSQGVFFDTMNDNERETA